MSFMCNKQAVETDITKQILAQFGVIPAMFSSRQVLDWCHVQKILYNESIPAPLDAHPLSPDDVRVLLDRWFGDVSLMDNELKQAHNILNALRWRAIKFDE